MSGRENLCTASELGEMASGPGERIELAVASGEADRLTGTYGDIEATWRAFCTILDDWVGLDSQFLLERFGEQGPGRSAPADPIRRLAARHRIGPGSLTLSAEMLGSPENTARAEIETAAGSGDWPLVRKAWSRADAAMKDAVTLRCENVNRSLGEIHGRYGDEVLGQAMLYAADRGFWRDALPEQASMDPVERTRELAFFLTAGARCAVEVVEEPSRFTIVKIDCHCGRIISAHQENGWDLAVVRGPSPLTMGLPAMTPYQVHFAVIHGAWAIDRVGQPLPAFDCAGIEGCSKPCLVHVFKSPEAIPERYFAAVGRASGQPGDRST